MTAISRWCSPCRDHPCSAEHADLVRTFRSIAEQWAEVAERATGGYPSDLASYVESNPRPSFKQFLIASRQPREAAA